MDPNTELELWSGSLPNPPLPLGMGTKKKTQISSSISPRSSADTRAAASNASPAPTSSPPPSIPPMALPPKTSPSTPSPASQPASTSRSSRPHLPSSPSSSTITAAASSSNHPSTYDDSWVALKWVVSHSDGGGEAWLAEHGDLAQVFLSGDSAGANIAYNVAMRAGDGVKIEGLALVHPYFFGSEPLGTETADPANREFVERIWRMACSTTEGADDPLINPLAAAAPPLKGLACRRVVVFVAGKDILKYRGRAFYEALLSCGWEGEAELVEDEGVDHVFHLFEPTSDKAVAKMEKMVAFLKAY